MLNFRTFILFIGLAAIFVLTLGLVAARTHIDSHTASFAESVAEIQRRSANLSNAYGTSYYRSQYGECFDVPIREVAACRSSNQASVQADRSPVDECFDVSLWEVVSCRKANRSSAP